jgi:Cdc6-like AAA superfamily ATPase
MAERDENLSLNHPFGSTVAASKDRQEILLDNNDSKPISNCPPIPTFQDDSFVGGSPNSGLHTQEDANEDTSLVARKSLEFATGVDSDIDIDIDDDDDDDDSSLSSSSSWVEGLTLLEKAEQNRERNALYLRNLNEKYHGQVPTTVKRIDDKLQEEEEADDSDSVKNINVPRGMLMKGSHRILRSLEFDDESETLPDRIQRLYQQYPHRDSQIRRLASLLHSTILQVSGEQTGDSSIYVPAPIFVVGPRGTGKTSVVCDVVETLEKNERRDRASRVASAYINCFTLEPSSIERLVYNAYNQLRPEEYTQLKKLRRKDRRKRKRNLVPTESLSREQEQVAGKADTVKEAIEHSGDQLKDSPDKTKKTDEAIIMVLDDQQADGDKMDSSDRRVQPRRTVKASSENNIAAKSAEPAPPPQGRRARGDTVETSTAAVVAFGRSLQPFYGVGSRRCAFLILDHGERLLSLSARKSKNEKTNFLAEILLLPKVMKLNLTVIIITNHSTLDRTRK